MKPRFNPLAVLALLAVAALLTAAVVPSAFVFPTRQAVQTLTGSRALVSNSSGLLTNSAVTSTELGYVSGVTSAIQTQLDAKATAANLTTVSNTVTTQGNTLATNTALLNGTNTFTGTNNFTGTVLITNAASTISGNGAGLTNLGFVANTISVRTLWSSPTNFFFASISTNLAATNSGGIALITSMVQVTLPALLTSNSSFGLGVNCIRTNTTASAPFLYLYAGPNTNYIGSIQIGGTTVGMTTESRAGGVQFLFNNHSFTNQTMAGFNTVGFYTIGASNFLDTSVPWTLYVGWATSTSHTNLLVTDVTAYETVKP